MVDGLSFQDACYKYGPERFGVPSAPWRYDDLEAVDAAESALFDAIAARGLEVAGYI